MKRREFIALIGVSAAWPAVAQAQQPTLGLLSSSEMADWAIKSFRAGLEEGGYVEGRNRPSFLVQQITNSTGYQRWRQSL